MIAAHSSLRLATGSTSCRQIVLTASRRLLSKKPAVSLLLPTTEPLSSSGNRTLSTTTAHDEFRTQGILNQDGLVQFDTLHEMQDRSCRVFKNNELFGTYSESSQGFEYMTYGEYGRKVNQCRMVLKDLGIGEFDKVAIISNNRNEWPIIAAAAYSLRASLVPMYEQQLASDWTYILNDSGCSAVFCATEDIFQRVQKEVLPQTPGVKASICLDADSDEPYSFVGRMEVFAPDTDGIYIQKPTSEDLANLIYTSGTTGQPKGVELTHLNFTSNVKAASQSMVGQIYESDRSLAFLPWAHSYGQTCELWMGMSIGASMGICRGVPMIIEDIQMVKPSVLFAVPTLYKKIFDGVNNVIETSSPLRRALMKNALAIGFENAKYKAGERGPLSAAESLKFKALDSIVLSKIRDRFGGNLRFSTVAAAACPVEVLNFMDSLGIPVCEGYGLSETSPIITLNTPHNRKIGSVGQALDGVTVYVVDKNGNPVPDGEEGEICCVGPNVMKGYYNNKKATDEVISVAPDGKSRMFHTGDMGCMVDGWVKVTGRLKEQYKLENGKYVVPGPIEEEIGMSRFISQVVLYGANRPSNVALIVPEWNAIRSELDGGENLSEEELANDKRVRDLIQDEITGACYKMKKYEIPTNFALVAPFTAANNQLTPKMSIRKHKVVEAYADVIARLYGDADAEMDSPEEKVA